MHTKIYSLVSNNKQVIIDNIKIFLYQEDPNIFNELDFNNDAIFLEPMLFSYFNSKKNDLFPKEILMEILHGYFTKKKISINYSFYKNKVAYIPQIGYFKKGEQKPFMLVELIKNTSIEVLKYSHPLIDAVFKTASTKKIDDNDLIISEDLFNKNIGFLTNAFHYIKKTSIEHFNIINQACKKCVLFKTAPGITNSFATINAHGMAFINVYQDDYDEVFFVDDIAHQTGHIILTTILFERKKYFIIDENQNISVITNKKSEYRSFYTLFHALFTYYTSLLCLDNCIEGKCFNTRQIHEAKGRISFYINKLILDMDNFMKVIKYFKGIEFVLTKDGVEIYSIMKNTLDEMITKWYSISKNYDFKINLIILHIKSL